MRERLFKSIGADWAVDWLPFGCKSVKCQMPLPFCLPMHLDGLSRGPVVQWSNGPMVQWSAGGLFRFLYLVITRWRLRLSASAL